MCDAQYHLGAVFLLHTQEMEDAVRAGSDAPAPARMPVRVGSAAIGLTGRADRVLSENYEPLRHQTVLSVRGKLRAQGIDYGHADLEAFYNQAWHALYDQIVGGVAVESLVGFLVQVAYRRAIDDFRSLHPAERMGADILEQVGVEDGVEDRLDDQRHLREFIEALSDQLSGREQTAAALCYVHGYTRPEAARIMGLSERRFQKLMDELSKQVGRFTRQIRRDEWCTHRESLMKAYALGLLEVDGQRFRAARSHLDECSACRADVLRMRGLAAVAPVSLLPWAAAHLGGAAAAAPRPTHPRGRSRPARTVAGAGVVVIVVACIAAFATVWASPEHPRAEATTTAPRAQTVIPRTPTTVPRRQRTARRPALVAAAKRVGASAARLERPAAAAAASQTTPTSRTATVSSLAPVAQPAPSAPPAAVVSAPAPAARPAAVQGDSSQEFGFEP